MKKNKKSKWILLLACLASLFVLGGCAIGESLENALDSRDLTAQVTYYSNGGTFEGTPDRKDMYYKEGSKALNIGKINPTNGTATISRNDYDFDGWYYAVLDGNGKPLYVDQENGLYQLGEKVDFSVALEAGDHWHLVAKWSVKVVLNIKLVLEDGVEEIPVEVKEGETAYSYRHGQVVKSSPYGDGKVEKFSNAPFTAKDDAYTYVEYYTDEACTQPVKWPIHKGETQTEDAVIYVKYIDSSWTVIRDYRDVRDMLSAFGQGKKFYLANNVDATRVTYTPQETFHGEIQGNGFCIENLNVSKKQLVTGESVSLFGNISSASKIENLELKGLNIEYSLKTSVVETYFAFTSIEAGATITNVQLSGTMKVTKKPNDILTARLYGGYESDEAYLAASQNSGFTVDGTAEEVIQIQ